MNRLTDVHVAGMESAARKHDSSDSPHRERKLYVLRNTSLAALAALILLGLASPAFAQGRQLYPEGSIFLEPAPPHSLMPNGGNTAERSAHRSPFNLLDAPDAENVWKPSNRDAGNLAEERWGAYEAHRRDSAALPAEPSPSSAGPAYRYPYPSYDNFDDFFARVFH